jgi:hypothetical protein
MWALAGLLAVGVAIRIIACFAICPVATTLSDSASYATDAAKNPLLDPQHPAGYPVLLDLIGLVTHSVAVTVLLQHALGVSAAVLLFAAVRRLTGAAWPALIPAAVVLLNTDEIFLEHNIMSEGPFVFIVAASTYAAVRTIDAPHKQGSRWAAAAGAAIAVATTMRTSGLFMIPFLALAIARTRRTVGSDPAKRSRTTAAFLATAIVLLSGYAVANSAVTGTFSLAPAPGWHFYARVAPFADCGTFSPPAGTRALCESNTAMQRSGPDWYLYDPHSPARRTFGRIGSHDRLLGSFAIQVFLHQPGSVAHAFWVDVRRYFVPAAHEHGWYKGWDLDPQLDWSWQAGHGFTRDTITGLEKFFTPFVPTRSASLVYFLHSYGQVFGFGGTLLTVCTLLTIAGLCVGSRRHRAGVMLFGIGGLAQLVGPTIGVLYMGRYTVPVAGPIAAGAAIALSSVTKWGRQRAEGTGRAARPRGRPAAQGALSCAVAESRMIGENSRGGL